VEEAALAIERALSSDSLPDNAGSGGDGVVVDTSQRKSLTRSAMSKSGSIDDDLGDTGPRVAERRRVS
jgi:hypothetical protein